MLVNQLPRNNTCNYRIIESWHVTFEESYFLREPGFKDIMKEENEVDDDYNNLDHFSSNGLSMGQTEVSLYNLSDIDGKQEIDDEESDIKNSCEPSVSGSEGLDDDACVKASDELSSRNQLAEIRQSRRKHNSDEGSR